MKKYGFPFRGSKDRIADEIISILPQASNLYDLFAGGGAITHCAILSGKWNKVVSNDIQGTMSLFLDAVAGKYANESRWISREEFHAKKSVDHYIRWIWSFGNDGRSYLFGKDIEPIKKEAHGYLFANGYDKTTKKRVELIKKFKEEMMLQGRFELQQLERLQQLEQLERLQQLEQLERIERLEIHAKDYREITIAPDSVIYCDIPYSQKEVSGKEKYYGVEFSKDDFYEWAKNSSHPVYFSSSLDAPFKVVWEKQTDCRMNNKGSAGKKSVVERLYWNGKLTSL